MASHRIGSSQSRIGFGYDIHRFGPKRKFILGGVHIPSTMGLLGHSDADVLLHAICDALLGAAALGDIGRHFPDSEKKFKNISSLKLLGEVGLLLRKNKAVIHNIDSTVVLERPKVSPHILKMQRNISVALGITRKQISIKATTNERLGPLGAGKGCAAFAVASIFFPS